MEDANISNTKIAVDKSFLLELKDGIMEAIGAEDGSDGSDGTYLLSRLNALLGLPEGHRKFQVTEQPEIVCLCGSMRFSEAFQAANLAETLAGRIVLTIGCDTKGDDDLFCHMSAKDIAELKTRLDTLHFRKIDIADQVLILNVGGYIGESTSRELMYAKTCGKVIRFWEANNEQLDQGK